MAAAGRGQAGQDGRRSSAARVAQRRPEAARHQGGPAEDEDGPDAHRHRRSAQHPEAAGTILPALSTTTPVISAVDVWANRRGSRNSNAVMSNRTKRFANGIKFSFCSHLRIVTCLISAAAEALVGIRRKQYSALPRTKQSKEQFRAFEILFRKRHRQRHRQRNRIGNIYTTAILIVKQKNSQGCAT